jgi:hypothetical protein
MTAPFDWNQYQPVEPQAPAPQQGFDWNSYAPVEKKQSVLQEIGRHAARTTTRVLENIAGSTGDVANIASLPARGIKKAIETVKGKELPEELDVSRIMDRAFPLGLPTTGRVKESVKQVSKGKLEPEGKIEELGDELTNDITSLLISPSKTGLLKTLGVTAGSIAAKEGVKIFGGSETAQDATKAGSLVLLSALNPRGASKYVSNLYKEAKATLPTGATTDARNLSRELTIFKNDLQKGLGKGVTSKSKSLSAVKEIQNKIRNNNIRVDELTEFKTDLNQLRSGLYQEFQLDKSGRKAAKHHLDSLSSQIDRSLDQYGRTNPQWEKLYRDANEGYGAIASSKKASNWIHKTFIPSVASKGVTGLAGLASLIWKPITIPAAAAGYAALKTSELLVQITKSPALQKYYAKAIEGSLKQNSRVVSENLTKMDAYLKKHQSITGTSENSPEQ